MGELPRSASLGHGEHRMRSPFAIFRKHAKVLTVVLTGLAMFAFIVMDQIRQTPEMFPILMGGLLCGAAFWILGKPSGKATEYSIGGFLIGVVLMAYVVPAFNAPGPAVSLENIDDLSQNQLRELISRRQAANQFLQFALAATEQPRQEFGFGRQLYEEDVVLGYLLQHEAKEMGIEVSDEAVSEFINQTTGNKLGKSQLKKIRTDMRLSETQLYEILSEQLQARMAMTMTLPREFPTPNDYWKYYRQLNVKQEIEVAAVPVSAFIDDEEPDPAEVQAFFDLHKTNFPSPFITPEPAFGQPRKIQIAYLEVDYKKARSQVEADPQTTVTDQQIEEFYEQNKDERYSNEPLFGDETSSEPSKTPVSDKPLEPEFSPDETPLEAPVPQQSDSPTKGPVNPQPDAQKPNGEDPAENNDANNSSDQSDPSGFGGPQESEGGQTNDDLSSGTEATESTSDDGLKSEPVDTLPVEAPVPGQSSEPLPKYVPLDDDLKATIRDELLHNRTRDRVTEIRRQVKFFMDEIDEEYHALVDGGKSLSAGEEVAARVQIFAARVQIFAKDQKLSFVELELLSARELNERGQQAADLSNETVGITETLTDEDRDKLKYLIAQAIEVFVEDERVEDRPSVVSRLFSTKSEQLYSPEVAEDLLSNNQFVFWKTKNAEAHLPKLDDPGIREQVITAWKQFQARKPAEQRAEQLAEIVRKTAQDEKTMEEVLSGQTVTGKEGGLELTVRDDGESFSWLRTPVALGPMAFAKPRPELSTINAVEKAGSEFMRVVFDELKKYDVGVAPNADRSVYYIAKVKNRSANSPEDRKAFQDQFMRETLFGIRLPQQFGGGATSSYLYLTTGEQAAANQRWSEQLMDKYDFQGVQRPPSQQ